MISETQKHQIRHQQQNEIDDFTIYSRLSQYEADQKNREILKKIALEEHGHYLFLRSLSGIDFQARRLVVWFYVMLARVVGIAFALKLLERREESAKSFYRSLDVPGVERIYEQEAHHEIELIDLLNDRKLLYAGAIVLGMNDALVELTGTLSGIALAFDKSIVVGITGMIMGIAASLSMAGSAYLESKENASDEISPLVYSLYTGVSYILTTLLLVLPFFVVQQISVALGIMFLAAMASIVSYNFYISVAKDLPFWQRVREMSYITFGVAVISFAIGYVVKNVFGIEI
ncbi:MAG: VIT1/CCC1 family protein [Sulfuricurvum sp.]